LSANKAKLIASSGKPAFEERWMVRRAVSLVLLFTALGSAASAQQGAAPGPQAEGKRLFTQSCMVCHSKPQITAALYGPALNRQSLGGQDDVMREVIGNGTPRMPGFKYQFTPEQIASIVQYLKTVPAEAAAR